MMNKKGINIAILAIVVVTLSVAMFLLWANKDGFFWITYIFSIVAVLGVAGSVACLKDNNKQFASNLSLATISIVYLVANALCSVVFLWLLKVGGKIYLITHAAIFAVFLIIWLLGLLATRHINEQDR